MGFKGLETRIFSIFDREKRGFLLRLSQENQTNEFWFLIAQAPADSRQNHEHTPANDAKKPLLIQPAMIHGCMMLYGIVELLMYFLGQFHGLLMILPCISHCDPLGFVHHDANVCWLLSPGGSPRRILPVL